MEHLKKFNEEVSYNLTQYDDLTEMIYQLELKLNDFDGVLRPHEEEFIKDRLDALSRLWQQKIR